jgi:putative FmdB family regulatory protein
MPIYEYRCTACARTVEAIQKHDDPPLTICEACSGRLEKLVSRTAFHLKGGGWFQHDYTKSSGSAPAADSPSEGTTKKEETSGGSGGPASTGGCGSGSCGCKH